MKYSLVLLLSAITADGQAPPSATADPVAAACAGAAQTSDACEQATNDEAAKRHEAGIQGGIDQAEQDADDADAAIAPVLAKLTPAQKASYNHTEKTMQHFIDVQVTGDILFMGGYGSGGLYPQEEHADFENLVVDVAKTPPSAGTFTKSDAGLNAVYTSLLKLATEEDKLPPDSRGYPTITPEGLRAEQRAWIAYRDAFTGLGRTLHPNSHDTDWLAMLTTLRLKDLQQVLEFAGTSWQQDIARYNSWKNSAADSASNLTADGRARVATILDNLTPQQQAAWQRVQSAMQRYASAHAPSLPHASPTYAELQYQKLYGELYALQYNETHGLHPDPAKAAEGFAKNDANLNAEYQADMASTCLFQPMRGEPANMHRTAAGLRDEQRAWIALRDAWVDFLRLLYPSLTHAELANMNTGGRAFELRMLHETCERSGQPPREQ